MKNTEYSTNAALQNRRFVYTGLKRRRQLKLRMMWMLMTAILVLSSVMAFACFRSFARETDYTVRYKYYTSVSVPYGCRLEELAAVYYESGDYPDISDYIREICMINRLNTFRTGDNYGLRPGDSIILPYYSTDFK